MNRRKIARHTLAAVLISAIPFGALAITTKPAATPAATPAPAALSLPAQVTRLNNLKSRGGTEIDRRIQNLTGALDKLSTSTKLTAADKVALTKQLQDEVTTLTARKTKLTADTDLATARIDVAGIVDDYRVYVLMLPKARMVAATDRFTAAEDSLATLQTTLQTKITAAKTAGKNVTAMQASVDDMKAKTATATAKTTGLTAQLLALTPTDYNADHTVLMTYRATLATAQTSLKAARDDAKTIIDALKAAK